MPVGQLSRFWQDPSEPVPDAVGLTSRTPLPRPMETVETGIEYFLPTDALHWIPNGFVKVNLEVNAVALADDFYATLDEAAEQWANANLGAGRFSQVIMEP